MLVVEANITIKLFEHFARRLQVARRQNDWEQIKDAEKGLREAIKRMRVQCKAVLKVVGE